MTTDTFSLIGKSAASAVNTVISGAYEFIGTIDFKGWGKSIAAGINSYFGKMNWPEAGLTFSKAVNGILDTLLWALRDTNWQKVGQSIGNFIANIDWNSALSKIGQIVWAVSYTHLATRTRAMRPMWNLVPARKGRQTMRASLRMWPFPTASLPGGFMKAR